MSGDPRGMRAAVQRGEAQRAAAFSIQGAMRELEFILPVFGPGRLPTQRLWFDDFFTEMPSFSASLAIGEGDSVIHRPPEAKCAVTTWIRSRSGGLYVGAKVDGFAHGHRRQRVDLQFLFSGMAIAAPAGHIEGSTYTTDDPI